MSKSWFSYLNFSFAVFVVLFSFASLCLWLTRSSEIHCPPPAPFKTTLPKNSFSLTQETYDAIGEPLLSLQYTPPKLQPPDLRQHLIYYGSNGRPDASFDRSFLYFGLSGGKSFAAVAPGERLYLLCEKKQMPPKYVFSPQNQKTSLWIEATKKDQEAHVQVCFLSECEEEVRQPHPSAQFTLQEKEFSRFVGGGSTWEIGKWRVDGTLLARQRAKWFGKDRFLERHGGEEYQSCLGKERVDFDEGEALYSCFIKQGDCLIWENDRWNAVEPGEHSISRPLLHVKKIEDRIINFDLWDGEGKGKICLNLLKAGEPWIPQNIQQAFKFIGAKTRSQCVFEINKERVILKPQDWLLLTDGGWKKLSTIEEIEAYVERKASGTLFVFDGVTKKDEKQVLIGTLFNPSRSDSHPVEIAARQSSVSVAPTAIPAERESPDKGAQTTMLIPLYPRE